MTNHLHLVLRLNEWSCICIPPLWVHGVEANLPLPRIRLLVGLWIVYGHFIQSFREVHPGSHLKPYTSAGHVCVLRLSSCLLTNLQPIFLLKQTFKSKTSCDAATWFDIVMFYCCFQMRCLPILGTLFVTLNWKLLLTRHTISQRQTRR
jgi:hypothetical protein